MIKSAFLIYSDTYLGVTDDRATAVARAESHHHEARVGEVALVDVLPTHPEPTPEERWVHHERLALAHAEAMEKLRPESSSEQGDACMVPLTVEDLTALLALRRFVDGWTREAGLVRSSPEARGVLIEGVRALDRVTTCHRAWRPDAVARAQQKRVDDVANARARDALNGQRVLVHADGGDCHGMSIVDGRCVGCGLSPDMQSTAAPSICRELFRAMNALHGVEGCARCAFPQGRHASYCDGISHSSGRRDLGCSLPPDGWWCSREPGHPGPCAALPGEKRGES